MSDRESQSSFIGDKGEETKELLDKVVSPEGEVKNIFHQLCSEEHDLRQVRDLNRPDWISHILAEAHEMDKMPRKDVDDLVKKETAEFLGRLRRLDGLVRSSLAEKLKDRRLQEEWKEVLGAEIKINTIDDVYGLVQELLEPYYRDFARRIDLTPNGSKNRGLAGKKQEEAQEAAWFAISGAWDEKQVWSADPKDIQKASLRRASDFNTWKETVEKLAILPGPQQEAAQKFLLEPNGVNALLLMRAFQEFTPPLSKSKKVHAKILEVHDLEGDVKRSLDKFLAEMERKYKQAEKFEAKTEDYDTLSREARELFGQGFIGLEELRKTGLVTNEQGEVQELLIFSPELEVKIATALHGALEELQPFIEGISKNDPEALKRDYLLQLEPNEWADGAPLTMKSLQDRLAADMERKQQGKLLYDNTWYKDEAFYTNEVPVFHWVLKSRSVLPGSTGKNYLEETRWFRDYLTANHLATPEDIAECSDQRLAAILPLLSSNWQEAAKQLAELKVNSCYRSTPVSTLFTAVTTLRATGQRVLESSYARSAVRSSDGYVVSVGLCDAEGADVSYWFPEYAGSDMGVVLSRWCGSAV